VQKVRLAVNHQRAVARKERCVCLDHTAELREMEIKKKGADWAIEAPDLAEEPQKEGWVSE